MCNLYNTGIYGRGGYGCGCGGTTTVNTVNTYGNGRNLCGYNQRMCRDACGNVLTRNTGGFGCQYCCCPCHHHCGCGGGNNGGGTAGNNGNGTTGGNGIFRCITFCGYGTGFGNGTTQTTGNGTGNMATAYYARQYGLTCDDNADCVYNFNTQ